VPPTTNTDLSENLAFICVPRIIVAWLVLEPRALAPSRDLSGPDEPGGLQLRLRTGSFRHNFE
jgi:hypothetical protein